ncbi:hypothetical protein EVAR_50013_1 [Eumeta japonica]|uniref:Uncharacterized protein n=1 Tax=Eumeta variegata TaxID=151549 RepID=A0A4C1XMP2_EUMVA|nr:hypothetical protein EVAR_50013_1 [Eumeta japonica]
MDIERRWSGHNFSSSSEEYLLQLLEKSLYSRARRECINFSPLKTKKLSSRRIVYPTARTPAPAQTAQRRLKGCKRSCNPPEIRWSSLPVDTQKPRGVTSALSASRARHMKRRLVVSIDVVVELHKGSDLKNFTPAGAGRGMPPL